MLSAGMEQRRPCGAIVLRRICIVEGAAADLRAKERRRINARAPQKEAAAHSAQPNAFSL